MFAEEVLSATSDDCKSSISWRLDVARISSQPTCRRCRVVSAALLTLPVRADVPESQDPIKIALFDWTSVNLNAKILGVILTKLGYNVEYTTADYLSSITTA